MSSRRAAVLGGQLIPPAECSPAPPQASGNGNLPAAGAPCQSLHSAPKAHSPEIQNAWWPRLGCGLLSSSKKKRIKKIETKRPEVQDLKDLAVQRYKSQNTALFTANSSAAPSPPAFFFFNTKFSETLSLPALVTELNNLLLP